jgi:hypothetical protein
MLQRPASMLPPQTSMLQQASSSVAGSSRVGSSLPMIDVSAPWSRDVSRFKGGEGAGGSSTTGEGSGSTTGTSARVGGGAAASSKPEILHPMFVPQPSIPGFSLTAAGGEGKVSTPPVSSSDRWTWLLRGGGDTEKEKRRDIFDDAIRDLISERLKSVENGDVITLENFILRVVPLSAFAVNAPFNHPLPTRVEGYMKDLLFVRWDAKVLFEIEVPCAHCGSTHNKALKWDSFLYTGTRTARSNLRYIVDVNGISVFFSMTRQCSKQVGLGCGRIFRDGDAGSLRRMVPYVSAVVPFFPEFNSLGGDSQFSDKEEHHRSSILGKLFTNTVNVSIASGVGMQALVDGLTRQQASRYDDATIEWDSRATVVYKYLDPIVGDDVWNSLDASKKLHHAVQRANLVTIRSDTSVTDSAPLRHVLVNDLVPTADQVKQAELRAEAILHPKIATFTHIDVPSDMYAGFDGNHTLGQKRGWGPEDENVPSDSDHPTWLVLMHNGSNELAAWSFEPSESVDNIIKLINKVPATCRIVGFTMDDLKGEDRLAAAIVERQGGTADDFSFFQDNFHNQKVLQCLQNQGTLWYSASGGFCDAVAAVTTRPVPAILADLVSKFKHRISEIEGSFLLGDKVTKFSSLKPNQVKTLFFTDPDNAANDFGITPVLYPLVPVPVV